MSYYMQPNQNKTINYDEIPGSKPFSFVNRYITRDIMKTNDIEGAFPQVISGYTGTKPDRILAHSKSVANFDPSKINPNSGNNSLSKEFGKSNLYNPSLYKSQFENPMKPVKLVGVSPVNTDSKVLQSQVMYKSNRATKRFIPPPKSRGRVPTRTYNHPSLVNKNAENVGVHGLSPPRIDTGLKNDPTFLKHQADFYLMTPKDNQARNEKPENPNFRSKFAENAGRILGKSNSMVDLERDDQATISDLKNSLSGTMTNKAEQNITSQPSLGYNWEQNRKLYESLHARRSKGLAPTTDIAHQHLEVENHLRNRETAAYGKNVDFPSVNDINYHRRSPARMSYNFLSNEVQQKL